MPKSNITIVVTVSNDQLDEVYKDCEQWMNKMHEVYGVNVDACIDKYKEDTDNE